MDTLQLFPERASHKTTPCGRSNLPVSCPCASDLSSLMCGGASFKCDHIAEPASWPVRRDCT